MSTSPSEAAEVFEPVAGILSLDLLAEIVISCRILELAEPEKSSTSWDENDLLVCLEQAGYEVDITGDVVRIVDVSQDDGDDDQVTLLD
jgi:hypothetical protein